MCVARASTAAEESGAGGHLVASCHIFIGLGNLHVFCACIHCRFKHLHCAACPLWMPPQVLKDVGCRRGQPLNGPASSDRMCILMRVQDLQAPDILCTQQSSSKGSPYPQESRLYPVQGQTLCTQVFLRREGM